MNTPSGRWIDGCLLSGNGFRNTNDCRVATGLPFLESPKMFHELLLMGITEYDEGEIQFNSGVYQHQTAQGIRP